MLSTYKPVTSNKQQVSKFVKPFSKLFSLNSFLFLLLQPLSTSAQMAKLVDALVSGTSVSNDVQVRVLFWALSHLAQMVKLVDTPA
jgi:hypothetical protein